PTPKEWHQAALGTPDKESDWSGKDCHVAGNWPSQPGLTGSGEDCVSSAGAYDMVGNVWEWVDGTIFDGQYEGHALPEQGFVQGVDDQGLSYQTDIEESAPNYNQDYFWIKQQGTRGIARGGYWGNGSDAGVYSAYLVVPPSFSGTGVGFRCVK
ncbi:MAG: SUMF1/EgtB/PvdO family nonheme iron enzyme, partial [Candidatus Nealsonbacteria bacterium]|nr:SUMF1/EgtB/PvdO family nonheme iron enzyme [Candidatus Nealsonbacteria bacterium]